MKTLNVCFRIAAIRLRRERERDDRTGKTRPPTKGWLAFGVCVNFDVELSKCAAIKINMNKNMFGRR